jgi:hypothetical protein
MYCHLEEEKIKSLIELTSLEKSIKNNLMETLTMPKRHIRGASHDFILHPTNKMKSESKA